MTRRPFPSEPEKLDRIRQKARKVDARLDALEARVAQLEGAGLAIESSEVQGSREQFLIDELARAFGWPGPTSGPHRYNWVDIGSKIRSMREDVDNLRRGTP